MEHCLEDKADKETDNEDEYVHFLGVWSFLIRLGPYVRVGLQLGRVLEWIGMGIWFAQRNRFWYG